MKTKDTSVYIYAVPLLLQDDGFIICTSGYAPSKEYVNLGKHTFPVVIPDNLSDLLVNAKLDHLRHEREEALADLNVIEEKIKNMMALPAPSYPLDIVEKEL